MKLAVGGAETYATELPPVAGQTAASLNDKVAQIEKLNIKQEEAKKTLAECTKQITSLMKDAEKDRAKIVRLAEATFGPRAPKIKQFRPATEGRTTARKVSKTR